MTRTRWRWILAGVMALAFAIPFLIAHLVPDSPETALNLPPLPHDDNTDPALWKAALAMSSAGFSSSSGSRPSSGTGSSRESSLQKLEYKVSGDDPSTLMNITNLKGLSTTCSSGGSLLTSVSLSNVYLDAVEFSKSLQGCTFLEAISLENVWLIGNFSRVYLPNLSRFIYVQNGNDKRDSYKSPETLQQTLFFDKDNSSSSSPSWNVEKDLLNLGVEISLFKAGTKLIDIQPNKGEIYLNVKYCESVLVNVKWSYDSLTLINCNVTDVSVPIIPATLKYLNLRNAVQRTPTLDVLTQKLTNLEELCIFLTFHCDWPGYELYLNLSSLPKTLKRLGTNNVDTRYSEDVVPLSMKEVTVGSYVTNKTITEGFPTLFKNLDRINVVNVSDPSPAAGYAIIHQAIKMRMKVIAVVHLHRNYSTAIENEEDVLEVETVLDNAGLPKSPLSCFILELQATNGKYSAKELSEQERHQIRYKGLGFDKMDSFEDYIKWDSLQ